MAIKLNPSTFNESSPGRHEEDIDSDGLEKKEIHIRVKQKVDEDGLVYIGNDRSIYSKQNSPSKAAEIEAANGDPCTSEASQGIEVSEQFAQSSQAAPRDSYIALFGHLETNTGQFYMLLFFYFVYMILLATMGDVGISDWGIEVPLQAAGIGARGQG